MIEVSFERSSLENPGDVDDCPRSSEWRVLCLIVLPAYLHDSTRFDRNPISGLVVWGSMCVVGWLSAIVTFLKVGLGDTTLLYFGRWGRSSSHLGDGHPLRGLGLSEVVGLSVAFDITVLMIGGIVVTSVRIGSSGRNSEQCWIWSQRPRVPSRECVFCATPIRWRTFFPAMADGW